MGGTHGDPPIDGGADANSVEPVAATKPFQRVECLMAAMLADIMH